MAIPLGESSPQLSDLHIDKRTKKTLSKLSKNLKSNQHYEVVKNTHNIFELKIVNNHSFFSKIKYYFQKDNKNKEVKKFISSTVVDLINELAVQEVDDGAKKALQALFFNRLGKLPQELFDRRVLGDEGITDRKLLPEILHPELLDTKDKLTAKSSEETDRKLERRIEKTRLAAKLGIGLNPISQGASGSYFARDHKMKIIGVFKPGEEESGGLSTPKLTHRLKNQFFRAVFGFNAHAAFWPGEGYVAEAMTSKLAEHLDVEIVARSKVTSLSSDKFAKVKKGEEEKAADGSFQIFAPKMKSADEFFNLRTESSMFGNMLLKLNTWRYKDQISEKISQSEFEKMALIDGLLCNRDRHFENWLVSKKEKVNEDGTINQNHTIALIDHQLSFPKANPPKSDFLYGRNQNKWAILPQAEHQFSPEIKDSYVDLLTGKNLKKLLASLQEASSSGAKKFQDPVVDGEIQSQEFAFKQRAAVLLLALDKGVTIREYASVKTMEDMEEFVKNNGVHFDINNLDSVDSYLKI